jgi:hypothetical protein
MEVKLPRNMQFYILMKEESKSKCIGSIFYVPGPKTHIISLILRVCPVKKVIIIPLFQIKPPRLKERLNKVSKVA